MINIESILQRLNAFLASQQDKVLHSFFGCWIAFAALVVAAGLHHHFNFHYRVTFMIASPVLAGVLKEVYDEFHPSHTADKWDIVATVLGAVPVWAAYYLGGIK